MVISILAMLISSKAACCSAHWAQLGAAMEIQHVGVVSLTEKKFVKGLFMVISLQELSH